MNPGGRVALVHDFLLDVRGAERVFLELCAMWPDADVFTAIYDQRGTEDRFADRRVQVSYLQRLRPSASNFRVLLPLYPAAIQSLDLTGYDLVISSSSAWAHGVRCGADAVHVSYCHNPFRYAWSELSATLGRRRNPIVRGALRELFRRWQAWDREAAGRTDRYVANSQITQSRVGAYFGRDAAIVHPPVQTSRFAPGVVGDHYVILSELLAHKQIDVAISAFNRLGRPLVVIGDGPAARRLRSGAGPTIRFAGRVSDAEVEQTLASCRALIVTSVEEFGIAAVEAQAAGRPVIARRAGGVLETVVDTVTGRFWSGDATALAAAVRAFDDAQIDPLACVANAARFGPDAFRAGIRAEVDAAIGARNGERPHGSAERSLLS